MKRIFLKFDNLKRFYSYKLVKRPNLRCKERNPKAISVDQSNRVPCDLTQQLRHRINATGPITVADYMREVLTNPLSGYYMNHDVFGQSGDFITSPEISQIFGELISVWFLMEWKKLGSPTPLQIVELGPGRGTLLRDLLRVFAQFKIGPKFSLHLVEISPFLSQLQAQRLCFNHQEVNDESCSYYYTGETASGTQVYWHRNFDDVPRGFSLILAHEFFDALPVHKMHNDQGIWKEIVIDVNNITTSDENKASDFKFEFRKANTALSRIFQALPDEKRDSLEYCIDGEILLGKICKRIESDGGISLIMDYGHMGEKTDTFRAFKQHKLHDPLEEPGSADLTADVDFKRVKHTVESFRGVVSFGPVEQRLFLQRMEGEARLEVFI